jgi:hypothetical protein
MLGGKFDDFLSIFFFFPTDSIIHLHYTWYYFFQQTPSSIYTTLGSLGLAHKSDEKTLKTFSNLF